MITIPSVAPALPAVRSLAGALAAALTLATGALAQEPLSWSEFRTLDRVAPDAREVWGPGENAFGEMYLPSGRGPHPVVVLVHGGCWRSIAGVDYMSHLARALAEEGWAVWSPEFRRVDQPDAQWPAILVDVGRATDHLRALAQRYPLDLEQVVAMGHSSGGHLALWLAGRERRPSDDAGEGEGEDALRGPNPLPIVGVVGLAAIADLSDFHLREGGGCGAAAVEQLLDEPPAEWHDRMRLASPSSALPLGVPQLLVTGALDTTVPAAHARQWAESARAAGDSVQMVIPVGAGHFEVVAPWTAPFESAWTDIADFLRATTGR